MFGMKIDCGARLFWLVILVLGLAQGADAQQFSNTPVATFPTVTGSVSAMAEANGVLYIGGSFSHVGGQARTNLAAINTGTGAVLSWNPSANDMVEAMLVVGGDLYVGGEFTNVGGQVRKRLCSFNLASISIGALGLSSWAPDLDQTHGNMFGNGVLTLGHYNGILYAGGTFGRVNGSSRGGVASFDLNNLAVNSGLTVWDPNTWAGGWPALWLWGVCSLAVYGPQNIVVLYGYFEGLGGNHVDDGTPSPHAASPASGSAGDLVSIGSVSATGTGMWRSWDPDCGAGNCQLQASGTTCYLGGLGFTVSGGGTSVPRNNLAAIDVMANTTTTNPVLPFDPNANDRAWSIALHPGQAYLFTIGNFTQVGGQPRGRLAAVNTQNGALVNWNPGLDSGQGGFVLATATRVYVGGPFTTVGGQARAGLAAFDINVNVSPELDVSRGATAIADGGTDSLGSSFTAGTATSLTYTIANSGGASLGLFNPAAIGNTVNCSASITTAPAASVASASSTTTALSVTPSAAGAFSFTYSLGNTDANENPYNFTASGTASAPAAPEIAFARNATAIADGGTDNTGTSYTAGVGATLTYTISNSGGATLTLGSSSITGASNCAASVATAPASSVAAAGSTTTTLSVTPAASGAFSFSYAIGNNDANENPYNFTVSGSASAPAAPEMDVSRGATAIADGGTDNIGNVASGAAQTASYTIANSGTGGLNLTGSPNLAQVVAGSNVASINVTTPPNPSVAAGGNTSFTVTYTVSGPGAFSFSVSLDNSDANENPYNWTTFGAGSGSAQEMDVARSTPIADGGSDTLSGATEAVALTLTYTISNSGSQNLQITTPVTIANAANCLVVVSQQPGATVAGSASTTMVLSVTPLAAGSFSFDISVVSNDADENPYNWSAGGVAAAAQPSGPGNSGSGPAAGGGGCIAGEGVCAAWMLATLSILLLSVRRMRRQK